MVYQSYIADCLQLITENTAKFCGGKFIKKRYIEAIQPKRETIVERSGTEIAGDIISRLTTKGGE